MAIEELNFLHAPPCAEKLEKHAIEHELRLAFGKTLINAQEKSGVSTIDLGKITRVGANIISRLKTGTLHGEHFAITHIERIAMALNCSVSIGPEISEWNEHTTFGEIIGAGAAIALIPL